MPKLISQPTTVNAAGNIPKRIEEYVGRVNSSCSDLSIARMVSPAGWIEPGQRPEFQEMTLVLKGKLKIEHERGEFVVEAGQAVVAEPGEWVRYSSPYEDGAEYIVVCLPAFSTSLVHKDE